MCEECKAFEDAIINKHLYCIIRLKEEGTNYDKNLGYCSMAAFSGDFEILKYLIDNFAIVPLEPVCNYSVIGGSLCCLVTAYSGGFYMTNNDITKNSALRGDIGCLRYAIDNGCGCDQNICEYAVAKDSIACFVYLLNMGYECTNLTAIRAFLNGRNSDCYSYILRQDLCIPEDIEEYNGLSLAQSITRYNRRRSLDFLSMNTEPLNDTGTSGTSGTYGTSGYMRQWRNIRRRAYAPRVLFEHNEVCGR